MALRPRKSSSKCLEAMFEGNETAAAKSAQGLDWKSKSLKVHHKQMNSTPVDHNANVLHCPPVSSF